MQLRKCLTLIRNIITAKNDRYRVKQDDIWCVYLTNSKALKNNINRKKQI